MYFYSLFQTFKLVLLNVRFSTERILVFLFFMYFGLLKLFPELTFNLHSAVTHPQVCRLRSTATTILWFTEVVEFVYVYIF